MITAAAARKKASAKYRELIDQQMTLIEIAINDVVNRGQCKCVVDFALHRDVTNELMELGYTIGCNSNRVGCSILW